MLLHDELPGTHNCANCGCHTDHLIRVSVVCEQVVVKETASTAAGLIGCLAFGWVAGLAALVLSRAGQPPVQHGTHVAFTLPVRVCEACATDRSAAALRKDLTATTVYAALLQQYPNATVSRLD